jgi:hypothetical protein
LSSKFKVGDKVKVISLDNTSSTRLPLTGPKRRWLSEQETLIVISFDESDCSLKLNDGYIDQWVHYKDVVRVIKINDLNKLLYPEYIEENGYLVPKEKYENS